VEVAVAVASVAPGLLVGATISMEFTLPTRTALLQPKNKGREFINNERSKVQRGYSDRDVSEARVRDVEKDEPADAGGSAGGAGAGNRGGRTGGRFGRGCSDG
jgi:hypothetical protein